MDVGFTDIIKCIFNFNRILIKNFISGPACLFLTFKFKILYYRILTSVIKVDALMFCH